MGSVLLAGGIVGSVFGVRARRRCCAGSACSISSSSICYVTFLGVIGTLMLIESVNAMRKARGGVRGLGRAAPASTTGSTACR